MPQNTIFSQKKIYDSIHGFIRLDDNEKILIDNIFFQRLRYISQLGVAYLVYPGATHNRFEHSLGVMDIATRIYDKLCQNVRPDLFQMLPRKGSQEYNYWRKILRIAALCHDLGHIPFSHVAEEDILHDNGHEEITLKIIEGNHLDELFSNMTNIQFFSKRNIKEDLIKVAIGEEKLKQIRPDIQFTSWEQIVSQIITGDYFGADRIDYLLRDAKYTGIAYGMFDYLQLIEQIRIVPVKDNLELAIDENGIEACEALLLARHFMHKRVYQYPSIKAFNYHLRQFIKTNCSPENFLHNLDDFVYFTDPSILNALVQAIKKNNDKNASAIIKRKDHFKAILLPENIKQDFLLSFKKKFNLSDEKISWDFKKNLSLKKVSFWVAKKHLQIQKIENCSTIIQNLPSDEYNWVYIDPEYEILILNAISKEK